MRSLNTRFLIVLITLAFLGLCVSVPALAGKEKNCDPPNPHPSCGGGGGDTSDAPDPSNLVRASFVNFGGNELGDGGISADGLHTCDYQGVIYDYWAWQERLLSPEISMVTGIENCDTPENRSDVSGGGRWFLMTSAGEVRQEHVVRWLKVDFSESDDDSPCPDLDGDGGSVDRIYFPKDSGADHWHPSPNLDECVDNLTVRLAADRILKNKANSQQLDITIRHRPNGSDYWIPWGSIIHINSLYLRDPSEDPDAPFFGRDCRVMSTRPAWNEPHNRQEAELSMFIGPSEEVLIGTYNLPLEVCVTKASG